MCGLIHNFNVICNHRGFQAPFFLEKMKCKLYHQASRLYFSTRKVPTDGEHITYRKHGNGSLIGKTFDSSSTSDILLLCFRREGKFFKSENDLKKFISKIKDENIQTFLSKCKIIYLNEDIS